MKKFQAIVVDGSFQVEMGMFWSRGHIKIQTISYM